MDIDNRSELTMQQLQSKLEEYKNLLENVNVGIFQTTVDGKLIQANPAFVTILGYKNLEELKNLSVQKLYRDPKDRQRLIDILKKDGQVTNFEIYSRRADNSIGWGSLSAAYIKAPGSSEPTIWGSLVDISDRKAIELQLRLSEEKYAQTFKTSPDAITLSRMTDGIFYDVNESFSRISGYSRQEAIGRSPREDDLGIWVSAGDRDRFIKTLEEYGEAIDLETKHRCKDGSIKDTIMSARIIKINNEKYILSTTRDVTEKRKLMEAAQVNQRLESLGVLAGGIAHDFNNLLSGIYSNVELTLHKTTDPSVVTYLAPVLETLKRATSLTHQLLTFARGGKPKIKAGTLFPFLEHTVKFALSGSFITCKFTVAENLLCAFFDENQISQVIENIIINALQAMPQKGTISIFAENITIEKTTHPLLQQGEYVCIAIADQGPGIPKDILPHIYDPFFSTKEKGTGLGLTTCYSIMKKHRGNIEVESTVGNGTTFKLYLPATNEIPRKEKKRKKVNHRGSGTVIVMDDDGIIQMAICSILKRFGYKTIATKNGEEVLAAYKRTVENNMRIKALLLDLTVAGGIGGKTTVEEIHKMDNTIKAFVISGYSDDIVMSQPDKFGFSDSLNKPFTTEDLEDLFEKHFGKSPH